MCALYGYAVYIVWICSVHCMTMQCTLFGYAVYIVYIAIHRKCIYTGCDNITSFFIMRGNQAVEVVAGWACFHSRDEFLLKYSQSLSCVGVVRNVRLPSKLTFRIDCL